MLRILGSGSALESSRFDYFRPRRFTCFDPSSFAAFMLVAGLAELAFLVPEDFTRLFFCGVISGLLHFEFFVAYYRTQLREQGAYQTAAPTTITGPAI